MRIQVKGNVSGRRGIASVLALAIACTAPHAAAQTDEERAGARAAAGEGLQALQEHRYADAVDLFTRAESLFDAPPHLLYLARAQTQLGLLVEAHENLEKVVRTHLGADAPKAFLDAQAQAQADLTDVEARLPYVTVTVEGGTGAAVTVTQDGKRISSALVGVRRPVDPGTHTFQGTATGLQGTTTLDVKEKAREAVVLKLEPVAASAVPVAAPVAAATPTTVATPPVDNAPAPAPPEPDQSTKSGKGMRIGSYAAFGVGVVGMGLGTVFALTAKSKQTDANQKFADDNCKIGCPDQKATILSLDDSASSARAVATVGFVVGGVGLATGVVLFILSNKHGNHEHVAADTPTIHPWIDGRSAGFLGTF